MKKFLLILLGAMVFILMLVMLADAMEPKKPDFFPYYSIKSKKPLGLYVLDKETDNLFKGSNVSRVRYTASDLADSLYDYEKNEYKIRGTFIRISGNGIDKDPRSEESLLTFASSGNMVFLSVPYLPESFTDSLGIKMVTPPAHGEKLEVYTADNPSKKYALDKGFDNTYFDLNDANDSIKVLGYQKSGTLSLPNFIEIPYGYGRVVLHTQPAMFSNYYLLKDHHYKYAEAVASKVPEGDIYWQVGTGHSKQERGLLDYFLKQPAFRAFWWLGWIALLLFIFFNARRRQRVVPIINPVTNTTIDFARTIGNLYYQEGDHDTIIEKKIIYFLEHIRREYFIDTFDLDGNFAEKLHAKTGKPIDDILTVVALIKRHRLNLGSSEADVIAINNAIEKLRL